MDMGKTIDRYGLKLLAVLVCFAITGIYPQPDAVRVMAAVGCSLCAGGLIDAVTGKPQRTVAGERKDLRAELKKFASAALTRKNASRFTAVALVLTLFSFFVPFALSVWYYVVIGINFLLAVLCFASRKS